MTETKIGADPPITDGSISIIPVYRKRTIGGPKWAMGEKEPLGIIVLDNGRLRIISFTGSVDWWDTFTSVYPSFARVAVSVPDE